jgi:hypothetical protein
MPPITGGVQYYNQKFIDITQHIDTFIMERARKHPRLWYDQIPRGTMPMYEGLVRQSNLYHGTLGEQSGLSNWRKIQTSRVPSGADAGYDACSYEPKRFSDALETISYSGFECSWQSDPICLKNIRFLEEGRRQAMLKANTMAYVTQSVWENWNRELYVNQTVKNGNSTVLARGGLGFIDDESVRFNYDAFTADADGDFVVTIDADMADISTIAWSFFDWIADFLGDECPEAALANESGMPLFGLNLHYRDIRRAIGADPAIMETYRFSNAKVLLDGYNKAIYDRFQGWLFMHDNRQMRLAFKKIDANGKIVLKRVNPLREGREVTYGKVPEANPAYHNAEYAIGTIMLDDVVANLIPGVINDLGAGMVFGPAPGFDGVFKWVNEYDKITNQANEVGFFWSRFEAFPKPLMYSNRAISFLYRRAPQFTPAKADLGSDIAAAATAVLVKTQAVADDVDQDNKTITLTLKQILACQAGAVTFGLPGGATSTTTALIADASQAPTYKFAFAADATIAEADFTVAATVTCG